MTASVHGKGCNGSYCYLRRSNRSRSDSKVADRPGAVARQVAQKRSLVVTVGSGTRAALQAARQSPLAGERPKCPGTLRRLPPALVDLLRHRCLVESEENSNEEVAPSRVLGGPLHVTELIGSRALKATNASGRAIAPSNSSTPDTFSMISTYKRVRQLRIHPSRVLSRKPTNASCCL